MTKVTHECWKCLGLGKLNHYSNIDNGVCYTCRGTGEVAYNVNTYRKLKNARIRNELKILNIRYIELKELEITLNYEIEKIIAKGLKECKQLHEIDELRTIAANVQKVLNEKKYTHERIIELDEAIKI